MLCHEYKCIFIHIPKSAGQSVHKFFARRLDPDYLSCSREYLGEFIGALKEIAKTRPFWSPGKA